MSDRMPPQGSLREALLLTVWLRRQEMEVAKTKALLTGMAISLAGDNKEAVKAFTEYVESAFPFAKKTKGNEDKKRLEVLEREVAKGPIRFDIIGQKKKNPLKDAARRMRSPDEFRKQLQKKALGRS